MLPQHIKVWRLYCPFEITIFSLLSCIGNWQNINLRKYEPCFVAESLDEDWEKDFDIEVTEDELQQAQNASPKAGKPQKGVGMKCSR